MPLVEITDVFQAIPGDALRGSYIDSPVPGTALDQTAFEIGGWLLGTRSAAREIQVVEGGIVLRTIPVSVARPDVVAVHPGAPEVSGFGALVGALGLEPEFTLELRAVLEDGTHVDAGSIRGRRQPLHSGYRPRFQTLLVTSLGRTGTTLLLNLLSNHPAIVAYRIYPYEIFPARYWLHLLRVLAEPADHAASAHPSLFAQDLQRVGHNPFHASPIADHDGLGEFFGRMYVERLARFSQKSIDGFYKELAHVEGKPRAKFFVEKFQPDHLPRLAYELDPRTKELILVRDFRDLICSVFAFNAKRGSVEFGREQFTSDEDYVRYIGLHARRLVAAWKSREQTSKLVRYEDLATRPHETLAEVLAYLRLNRKPQTIDGLVASAFDGPDFAAHRTTGSVEESIGRWRRELPRELRSVVQAELDEALIELGYERTA
jgi:Sulfotransferase family